MLAFSTWALEAELKDTTDPPGFPSEDACAATSSQCISNYSHTERFKKKKMFAELLLKKWKSVMRITIYLYGWNDHRAVKVRK